MVLYLWKIDLIYSFVIFKPKKNNIRRFITSEKQWCQKLSWLIQQLMMLINY